MASKSYKAGFKKYYGNRLDNISNETTEGEIKRIYDDWAGEYEEVILNWTDQYRGIFADVIVYICAHLHTTLLAEESC